MQATWIARRVELWLTETQSGRIHSRFHSVLNLAWGRHLITLALPEAGRLPGGILIDPATLQPGEWPGVQGDPVSYDPVAHVLRFPSGQAALDGAHRETDEPQPLARIEAGRVIANVQSLIRLASLSGKGELVPLLGELVAVDSGIHGGHPESPALQVLRRLASALAEGDGPALVAAARPMLGRGEGLTPAWDDLLLGLVATLWFASGALPAPVVQANQMLAEMLAMEGTTRTTSISANYLNLAADGGFSQRLADAVLALLTKSGPALVAPLQRLLQYGHSSGHDTAVGLVLGTSVITRFLMGGEPL